MSRSHAPPSYYTQRATTPNVLIVGETGVGKSSVINLIAGETLANVSSSASGCTLEATSYDVVLTDKRDGLDHHIRLFDTVGLNEPSLSKNDYLTAIEKASMLITQLQRTGGIRLLIFCIRGGRITAVTQCNYRLFCDILCQNQVPVAFVVTGMENQQPMEAWWSRNASLFQNAGLACKSHVCITATRGLNNVYGGQYEESQGAIHGMLLDYMSQGSWKPEHKNWFIQLAGMLLRWVTKINDHTRHTIPRRSKELTVATLVRQLEDKCKFSRKEAEELAGKIWAMRHENTVKREDAGGHPSDLY